MAQNWLTRAIKSVVPFSGWGGSGGAYGTSSTFADITDNFIRNVYLSITRYSGTQIDYAREIGDVLNSSLVMTAINWIARALPEAQIQVVKMEKDGKETVIPNHPLTVLMRRPNPFFSSAALWKAFAMSWLADGNVYIIKARNNIGIVKELWYAPSFLVEPRWPLNGSDFLTRYAYKVDGKEHFFAPEDMIHFRNGVNPYNMRLGLSPIQSILREIYSDSQIMNYQGLLLANGAVPPAVLAIKADQMNGIDVDTKEVKDAYLKSTQGDERGKVFVSNMAVELTKIAFSPSEMNLEVLRHMPEKRFAAVIGLPDAVLGFGSSNETSTYNNIKQADERAYENFMIPLWRFIEDELTVQLLRDFDTDENLRVKCDLRTVRALSVDEDNLYKRLSLAYQRNWIKKSEVRTMAGLVAGPEDEVYFLQESTDSKLKELAATPTPAPFGEKQATALETQKKVIEDFAYTQINVLPPPSFQGGMLALGESVWTNHRANSQRTYNDEPRVLLKTGVSISAPESISEAVNSIAPFTLTALPTQVVYVNGEYRVVSFVEGPSLALLQAKLSEVIGEGNGLQPHVFICAINEAGATSGKYAGLVPDVAECPVSDVIVSDGSDREVVVFLGRRQLAAPSIKAAAPTGEEIDSAVEWWRSVAPDAIAELINAEAK